MTDLRAKCAELARLAENATPGPYGVIRYDHGGARFYLEGNGRSRSLIADLYYEGDRELFAALSPEAVTEFVREVERLIEENERARQWASGEHHYHASCPHCLEQSARDGRVIDALVIAPPPRVDGR